MEARPDDYIMGRSAAERERLRHQATLLEGGTRRALDRVGLEPGMTCLDVGSGPGAVMGLMGERVGPTGHVTGLDLDGELGRQALASLEAAGASRFAFIEGDASRLEEIAGQPFDLTFARLLLLHAPDPVGLLGKMHRWTRPGGHILVQEYDFRSLSVHPRLEAVAEFERVWYGVCERVGRDTRIGLKLPALFVQAGIGAPDGTDIDGELAPLARWAPLMTGAYKSVLPRALELGITTRTAADGFFAAMTRAAAAEGDQRYWLLTPTMVAAWKRRR